jgi:isopentenyl diphosphate isomerase/L-lactate dehydrogenase-like FMN-dependent dehydrogenase
MISISLAAGVTAMWLVSLPVDQLLHHPPTDLTVAKTAETAQEEFEQARNAEIDASIAAVAARSTQEEFEQARNAEIDASIAAVAARRAQEEFEQARNAEIDASIAAVAAGRAQEEFEQARNAEIDASIAAITIPWALTFADMQVGSFAPIEVLEHPWQP